MEEISPILFIFHIALLCSLQIHNVSGIECGTPELAVDLRISQGNATRPHEWPWIAALFYNNGSKYICGGTIISMRHILTAAHCIQDKGAAKQVEKEDIVVRLGAYNLTIKEEEGVVQRNIAKIHAHPEWNANSERFDADLAILELSDNVLFTDYIRPICLPALDDDVDSTFIDVNGMIVGWGLDQQKITEEIPKEALIQALNDSYCYRSNSGIVSLSSSRTFCGIGAATPNRGDSGGGFFVDVDYVWKQYGIISALRTIEVGKVESNLASIYTNVKVFRDWIIETVAKSGIVVGGTNLKCVYGMSFLKSYDCELFNLDIRSENIAVESFTGTHEDGRTDQDVDRIVLKNGTMTFLPNGIGNLFRNLKTIEVGLVTKAFQFGTNRIRRSDFQNMENLKNIHINKNEIETIDEDTLWELPDLEVLLLNDNKLRQLHEKTFDTNIKLETINLGSNKLEMLPRNLFRHNVALKSVLLGYNRIKTIHIDFTELENIRTIDLSENVCINVRFNVLDPNFTEFTKLIKIDCGHADE